MKKFSFGVFHVSRLFLRFCVGKVKFNFTVGFDGLTVSLTERKKRDVSLFEVGVDD